MLRYSTQGGIIMSCPFYNFRQGDYHCNKKGDYVNSDTYYKYCRNYDYNDCPIYKQQDSSGCYLTTIVCDILGKLDDGRVLNTMRKFRDQELQTNPEYINLLKRYDMVGPLIAKNIQNDKDKMQLSNYLYSSILEPICKHIENKEIEKAVTLYEVMTLSLVNYYRLKKFYNEIDLSDKNYFKNSLGHGRVRRKES